MYSITTINKEGLEFLELRDSENASIASICLSEGASLQLLTLNYTPVIEDLYPLAYQDTYASSILFPFANRVKNGRYEFMDKSYKLECNENERNNALHGLVYNKRFNLEKKQVTADYASVTLYYEDSGIAPGFPFEYKMMVTYVLSANGIKLILSIQNNDQKPFPFTIGWHPYFKSINLSNSSLIFDASKEVKFDEQLIVNGYKEFKREMPYKIKDRQLDNAFILDNESVQFLTPEYNLEIKSSYADGFLQLYTPNKDNVLAIEPMTGVSDSLNNQIGLKVLEPNSKFQITWNVSMKKK